MLSVKATGYQLDPKLGFLYEYRIQFGRTHTWTLFKRYEDFQRLHKELCDRYGSSTAPKLTGQVRPWARTSLETAQERQPKLEAYLDEILMTSEMWEPPTYRVRLPHPEGLAQSVFTIESMFRFLEMEDVDFSPVTDGGAPKTSRGTEGSDSQLVPPRVSDPTSSTASEPPSTANSPLPSARVSVQLLPQQATNTTRKLDNNLLALAVAATSVTSHIEVHVRNFSIYKDDRIDYHVHLKLFEHSWVVSKRYSQFVELHERLVGVYGETTVPTLKGSKVPAWKKLDQKTGQKRQIFFDAFLSEVVHAIDNWHPQGLLTSFELEKRAGCSPAAAAAGDVTLRTSDVFAMSSRHLGGTTAAGGGAISNDLDSSLDATDGGGGGEELWTRFTVCMNQVLFEFFEMEGQISELNGDVAGAAVDDMQEHLTMESKAAVAKKQLAERKSAMQTTIARQSQLLIHASDEEIQRLAIVASELRDDRDVIRLFQYFVLHGVVEDDLSKLLDFDSSESPRGLLLDPIVSPRSAMTHGSSSSHLATPVKGGSGFYTAAAGAGPASLSMNSSRRLTGEAAGGGSANHLTPLMGITSEQLLKLVEPIAFNDTRIRVITFFAPVLVNIDDLQRVFDVLWYDWDVARATVEAILTAGS